MKTKVSSKEISEPTGCYSQGIVSTGSTRLYLSSLAPCNNGKPLPRSIKKQTELLIKNIQYLLEENGFTLEDIVKVNVYLSSPEDISVFNKTYGTLMPKPWPARSLFISFFLDSKLEMNLIAER